MEKIKELEDMLSEMERQIKGYGYDSLCLRYSIARDAQAEWEIHHYKKNPESAYKQAIRDKVRFYEILENLIGEHN